MPLSYLSQLLPEFWLILLPFWLILSDIYNLHFVVSILTIRLVITLSYFFRFRIAEGGARGSVVVFSDTVTEKNSYTRLTLNLDNKLSAREFWKRIDETPYIGYRTRIDLGFQVIEKEVFTLEDGKEQSKIFNLEERERSFTINKYILTALTGIILILFKNIS